MDGLPSEGLNVYINRVMPQAGGGPFECLYAVRTNKAGAWFAPNLQPASYIASDTCYGRNTFVLEGTDMVRRTVVANELTDFGISYWRKVPSLGLAPPETDND